MLDLGCSVDHAAVVRTVGYVLAAQDGPGHFGEGCSREGEEARLAASCLALRVVLRAGEDRRVVVRQHMETLLDLPELWNTWNESWSSDLVFLALGALALAPIECRQRVEAYATHVLEHQDRDGGWPGTHLFNGQAAIVLS